MEPEIRYCTSADGTRIAYTVYGRGEPALVFIVGWGITFQLEAQFDEGIAFYQRLSEKRMVVRYDPRGIGASSQAEDHSTDAHCSDAEAVISALQLETYNLFGTASGSPIALLHAHRHPESVQRIVLWEGWSAGNWEPRESVRAVVDLVKANWPLATRMMTDLMGVQGEDMRRRWARLLTTSIEPNAAVAYFESRFEIDVTDVVGDIAQPALLLHRRGNIRMPIKVARELASKLPNARFVELPGKAEPWILDHEDYLAKVEEFLGEDTPPDGEPRAAKEEVAEANLTRVSAPEGRTFASGRYVVKRLLGAGTQKSVYLVDDTVLGRQCALSMLNPALLDPSDVDRIKREAQTMAQFGTQPNIVTVYDYGEQDGAPFIVCEYVPGGELRDELAAAAGPMPLERTVAVAIDICRALSFAHGRDIVHRDIKPENVWLTAERNAKLGDFGIALSLGRTRLTAPGGQTGTPAYMAPEQASGGDVDARSDLYAFGALLYELVAGRPPFVGDDPNAIMYQHINAEPESPLEHNASLPPSLERLIMRLLAKPKADRPDSAEEVLAELEHAAR